MGALTARRRGDVPAGAAQRAQIAAFEIDFKLRPRLSGLARAHRDGVGHEFMKRKSRPFPRRKTLHFEQRHQDQDGAAPGAGAGIKCWWRSTRCRCSSSSPPPTST